MIIYDIKGEGLYATDSDRNEQCPPTQDFQMFALKFDCDCEHFSHSPALTYIIYYLESCVHLNAHSIANFRVHVNKPGICFYINNIKSHTNIESGTDKMNRIIMWINVVNV